MSTTFRILLLAGLVICAVATALVRKPMRAVIIYMAYSIIMSVVWLLLESPDLAITEAAVGAGITGILFFLTLRRINLIDKDAEHEYYAVKALQARVYLWRGKNEDILVQLWLHGGLDLSEQLQKEPPERPAENVSAHPTPRRDRTLVEQGVHRSLRLYNVLAGLLCGVLSALMLLTAADLPPCGSDTAPTVNEVARRYVEQGTEETGAVNTVAGMILDYRAFDTLGESFVLFTAMCAVTILLIGDSEVGNCNLFST